MTNEMRGEGIADWGVTLWRALWNTRNTGTAGEVKWERSALGRGVEAWRQCVG